MKRENLSFDKIIVLSTAIIGILSIFRYFWNLDAHPCFEDDEFQTIQVAQWYSSEITSLFQGNIISELRWGGTHYDRAWPYTVLLGNWIHIFGQTEAASRGLSALFGVLTVISLFYISYRLFDSLLVSVLSCVFMMAEPVLTEYFRLVRMYSMAVFLGLWLYYLLFRAISLHNPFLKDSSKLAIIDFQPFYAISVLIILYYSYQVHVNILIMLLGIVIFIPLSYWVTKERRFFAWSMCIAAGVLLLILGIFYSKFIGTPPFAAAFFRSLTQHSALFKNIYPGYLLYFLRTATNKWFGAILFIVNIVCLILAIKKKKRVSAELYIFTICVSTVFFFVFMTDRYFIEYYMCMLIPFAAMFFSVTILAIGNTEIRGLNRKIHIAAMYGMAIILMIFSVRRVSIDYDEIYTSLKAMNYPKAYEIVYDYYDRDDVVPIVGLFVREPYLSDTIQYYDLCNMNRENDMDILFDYATEGHSEGILTCEDIKFGALTQGMISFMSDWTDRLSGDGVDDTNVEMSHYCFLEPVEYSGEYTDNIENNGICSEIREKTLIIYLNGEIIYNSGVINSSEFVGIKVSFYCDNGSVIDRYYQLATSDASMWQEGGVLTYSVSLDDIRGLRPGSITSAGVLPEYVVYTDGRLVSATGDSLQ